MKAWEEEWPGNRSGSAAALTTLARVPRGLWYLRVKFWIRRLSGPPQELVDLSFIHYARTAIITDYGDHDYVYFESNFNGTFDAYIDAFSYVVPHLMKRIWNEAEGFPGPKPATPFKEYIRGREFPAAHFYAGYDATVTQVTAALALRDGVDRLARDHRRLNPDEFHKRWHSLWAPRRSRRRWLPRLSLGRRDTNVTRGGHTYGLTVLSRIRDGKVAALETDLAKLAASPFAELPETHFARLVVLDHFPFEAPPHLLFSCVFDGDPDAYLEKLCRKAAGPVDRIWGHCDTAPGSDDPSGFARWMREGQQTTSTFFAPYGTESRPAVEAALGLAHRVEQFAYEHQYATPGELYDAFGELLRDGRR